MAAPTIPNGEEHFFPIIYEGNGAGQRVGNFVPFTDNGTIANSVIFNDADNAYLSRTNDAGDRDTFTISVWVKRCALGSVQYILDTYDGSSTNDGMIRFNTDNTMSIRLGSPSSLLYITNRTFEDTSKFYHIMLSVNTGESTAADRAKLYVDGDRITSFSTQTTSGSVNTQFNYSSATFRIGSTTSGSYDFDGYLAEFNQVDGTALTPDTFGLTDTSTGRWIPKALTGITYGTNGFRLQFGSSSALGDDTSGNENDFSVTNLVAGDQTTDSPTQNHATWNPHPNTGGTLSEGNLKLVTASSGYSVKLATLKPKSGKYYAEFTIGAENGGLLIGVQELATAPSSSSTTFPQGDGSFAWRGSNGYVFNGGSSSVAGSTYTTGDVLALALDLDNQVLKFYKNNSLDNTIGLTGKDVGIAVGDFGNAQYGTVTANFGQKSFTYTPPTGFVALQQDNLPETAKGITGFTWIKDRDNSMNHNSYDSSNGEFNRLVPNATSAILNTQGGVSKFLKGGIAVGDTANVNNSGASMVAWNWVANGGTTASNSNGSITSTVQANTTAGFSIVQWTGDGGQSTVGHGLSNTPTIVIQKNLDSTSDWWFYTTAIDGSYDYLKLDSSVAKSDFSATAPTSTVFTSHGWGTTSMIGYCFHEISGYSKFSSYTGNGNADGPFVYTGFRPAWIMIKNAGATASWFMLDAARNTFNPVENWLVADDPQAEVVTSGDRKIDFLSNGFKIRATTTDFNGSSANMLYMAFAEHPFVGDGTSPVTAR